MEMKPVTEEEIFDSRLCKVNECLAMVTVSIPPYEDTKKFDYRTLRVFVVELGLRARSLPWLSLTLTIGLKIIKKKKC